MVVSETPMSLVLVVREVTYVNYVPKGRNFVARRSIGYETVEEILVKAKNYPYDFEPKIVGKKTIEVNRPGRNKYGDLPTIIEAN